MKKMFLIATVLLGLAACSSTGSGSSQMYGQIGGGVGYTSR